MESEASESAESGQVSSLFRRWLFPLTGLLIGGTFLYITARNVDLNEVLAAIYGIDSILLVPFTLVWFLNAVLRSVRWRLMFPDDSRPSLRHAVDGFLIGKVSNNFLPGRLGELVRASVIGRLYPGVGLSGTLATIMVEKIFDSLAILSLLGLALLSAPLPPWIVNAGISLIVFFSVLLIMLWIMVQVDSRNLYASVTDSATGAVARLKRLLFGLMKKFSTGLHALRSAQNFMLLSVLTIIIWGSEIILLYLLMQAFSISAPFMAAVVSIVFLCIGGMLPAAPGWIGTYQLFIVAAMQLYAVPQTDAFALSVFLNFYIIAMTSILGLTAVLSEGGLVSFRQVFASATQKV